MAVEDGIIRFSGERIAHASLHISLPLGERKIGIYEYPVFSGVGDSSHALRIMQY